MRYCWGLWVKWVVRKELERWQMVVGWSVSLYPIHLPVYDDTRIYSVVIGSDCPQLV